MNEARARSRVRSFDFAIALAVAFLAAWLRRRQLGPDSLWLDDAWPALVARVGWTHVPLVGLTAPGFAALLKAWLHVTGFSETKAQSVAFTFGIAGPALLWLLCVARGLGRLPAALATAILVCSPASIVYSARVKQYTLDAVLVMAILWIAWRVLDRPDDTRRWAQLAIVAVLATAISAAVVPVACGGFAAGFVAARRAGRAPARRALTYSGTYAAFGAVWWVTMLRPRVGTALHDYWSSFYIQTESPAAVVKSLARTPSRFDLGFVDFPNLLAIALVVLCVIVCRRTQRDALVLLLTPLLVAVVFEFAQLAPLGTGRTDLYLYPVVALLLALGASELSRRATWPSAVAIVALVAAIGASAQIPSAYPREDMKAAVRLMAAKLQVHPGEAVLVYYSGRYAFALYSPWPISVYPTTSQTNGFDVRIDRPDVILLPQYTDRSRYPAAVARLTARFQRLWFIGSHGHGDAVVIERSLVAAGFVKHVRYYRGSPLFLSEWARS